MWLARQDSERATCLPVRRSLYVLSDTELAPYETTYVSGETQLTWGSPQGCRHGLLVHIDPVAFENNIKGITLRPGEGPVEVCVKVKKVYGWRGIRGVSGLWRWRTNGR